MEMNLYFLFNSINFILHLISNEASFEYSFPQTFLDKKYEIGLLKLDGKLKIDNKINVNQTNNKFYYIVSVNASGRDTHFSTLAGR